MRKMPLNQIAFGKTDAFNELNTFGQEYFMESFVANPKYHIDDWCINAGYASSNAPYRSHCAARS